ncbi:hypothetical protein TNCV_348221 [Trichonephila clavipes]|nr:hypothetical protein TNCV_348221 [Trichonephila clavipes]
MSDQGRHVMSSSPVPLKTCRVRKRYTLNRSRAQSSSRCLEPEPPKRWSAISTGARKLQKLHEQRPPVNSTGRVSSTSQIFTNVWRSLLRYKISHSLTQNTSLHIVGSLATDSGRFVKRPPILYFNPLTSISNHLCFPKKVGTNELY